MTRRPGYVIPLLLIAIGFILLLDNLGLLHREVWGFIWHYWPVILILWGIEIIARHTESRAVYFGALFLSVLVIIVTVFLLWNGYPPQDRTEKGMAGTNFNNRNLGGWNFNFADLDNADFGNSMLKGADMNFASMQHANFSNSSLEGANMNFADLRYAKLGNAGLNGANLNFADLENADLSNAVLDGASLNFVSLNGANLSGARLNGANHAFAGTSVSTICTDSKNGPCW